MTRERLRKSGIIAAIGFGGFAVLVAALWLSAEAFSPELPEEAPQVSEEELERHLDWLDEPDLADDPPVLVVDVDYAQGKTAPWYPKSESPVLADLVAQGELPPVEERVGPEPMVMRGEDGIGNYGGTMVMAAPTENDVYNTLVVRLGSPMLVRWSPLGFPLAPNVARSWEPSDDFRTWIVHLRKGMRWSDGHPLTTDDVMYWWEQEMKALETLTVDAPFMIIEGEVGEVEPIDEYTLRFTFPKPHALFIEMLLHRRRLYSPRHYLEQYHPDLGNQQEIERLMGELHVPTKRALYDRLKDLDNPEHPRLWPWILTRKFTGSPYFAVRNPYFCGVDEQGNQLPYIDQVMFEIKSPNLITQAAIGGNLDLQTEWVPFDDYTLLMEQQEQGGYELYHWINGSGSIWTLNPNQTRLADPRRPATVYKAELLSDKRFRQALSLAIDRQRIIDAVYAGFGEPAQSAPPPTSPFYYPPLAKAFVEHDPERARAILDALGLTGRDAEGYRTFPDGSRMTWYIEYTTQTGPGPIAFVVEDFARVGLRAVGRERSNTLLRVIRGTRDYDIAVGPTPRKPSPVHAIHEYLPHYYGAFWAPGYGKWFSEGGYYDPELELTPDMVVPPAGHPIWEGQELFDRLSRTGDIAEQREIFHELFDVVAENLFTISIASSPPMLAIVSEELRNVPREMLAVIKSPANGGPELFYFENPEMSAGEAARIKEQIVNVGSLYGTLDHGTPVGRALGAVVKWLAVVAGAAGVLLLAVKHPFVGRRFVVLIPTLGVISIIVFYLIQLPPGNYVDSLIMQAEMSGDSAALEQVEQIKQIFPLHRGFWYQYADWMGLPWFFTFKDEDRGLLQADLGRSMENLQPVNDLMGERLLLTVAISLGTILFTWLVAVPIGIYSAVRKYTLFDYTMTLIGFIGMCVPNFLLAILLMYVSGEWFGVWVSGLFSPEFAAQPYWSWPKVWDMLQHIWIPVVVLGTGGAASMIRVMRGNLLDELKKPYVTTARAKGVRPGRLLLKYPVRMALNPFISGIGGIFPALVSGGAIVAIVMSLPTLGPLQLEALMNEDYYLAGSLLMVLSLLGVIGTLVSDLLLLWLDPRIRFEGGRSR